MLATLGACAGTGGLGNILGGVLGQGGSNQISGYVQSVNTRAQQIGVQQSNGQTVFLGYDNNTQVLYQNQNYPATALERGDQVTANVQDNGNGAYYTDRVQVDRSVSGNANGSVNGNVNGGQSGNLQSFQGIVRQVDRTNGWFTFDDNNAARFAVVLQRGVSNADVNRFTNLRAGDNVRFYGYRTSNSQIALQQFY